MARPSRGLGLRGFRVAFRVSDFRVSSSGFQVHGLFVESSFAAARVSGLRKPT